MAVEGLKIEDSPPLPTPTTVPSGYANGFFNTLGTSDISILMLLDSAPIMKVHMSYTTAKTLATMLQELVSTLEKATSHTIMPSSEVEKGLRALTPDRR